jgi:hypothetical protein
VHISNAALVRIALKMSHTETQKGKVRRTDVRVPPVAHAFFSLPPLLHYHPVLCCAPTGVEMRAQATKLRVREKDVARGLLAHSTTTALGSAYTHST